jgi:hypothetical protein
MATGRESAGDEIALQLAAAEDVPKMVVDHRDAHCPPPQRPDGPFVRGAYAYRC